jgi:HAMP domain-containing protein
MQQTTVSLSPKHDASGQPAPKGTPRVHNPGDADGSEAPPRAATGALSAVKPISLQSIHHTVRDRWRYVAVVFVGAEHDCDCLDLVRESQAPRTSVELGLAGLATAVAVTLLLVGALDVSSWRVRQVTATIEQIAAGDLAARVPARGPDDIGTLSRAVNSMAERLQRQSRKRNRERDRLHTVLHVMDDGVIILNKHGYVSVFNLAATAHPQRRRRRRPEQELCPGRARLPRRRSLAGVHQGGRRAVGHAGTRQRRLRARGRDAPSCAARPTAIWCCCKT